MIGFGVWRRDSTSYCYNCSPSEVFSNLLGFLVALFFGVIFFVSPLYAQTSGATQLGSDSDPIVTAIQETLPEVQVDSLLLVSDNQTSDEVQQDFEVSFEDLGAIEADVLPGEFWHGFKRFGRGLEATFTFDPLKKAAVRFEHANQQLSEIQQLIDEQGIEQVDGEVLGAAIDYYESKLSQVREQTEVIEARKSDDPALVDALLNELTEKQIVQQKVLDNIAEEVVTVIEDKRQAGEEVASEIEGLVVLVEDTKDEVLANFTATLTGVDEPEAFADRLNTVMAGQEGSAFKDLPNLDLLKEIANKVPDSVKAAVEQAKQETLARFEASLSELPPVVRAEQFGNYIDHTLSDEDNLMVLLEDLKQYDIPGDVLTRIEEAKESVVRKLERKLELFEDSAITDRFFRDFGDEPDELIALQEFEHRMRSDSQEQALLEELHNQSITAFKERFSDAQSQEQADLFAELTAQIATDPTPKAFELLRELEQEVLSDPTKADFLSQMEDQMRDQMEARFRQEGPRSLDRFVSLDPHDMEFLYEFEFDDAFVDQFADRNAEHYKDYMQDVRDPQDFFAWQDRFHDAPDFVFDEIRENNPEFQDVMQFKARKMHEFELERERELAIASLDYTEREFYHQSDRLRREQDDQFWSELNGTDWENFGARQELWEQKISSDFDFVEQRFTEQQRLFEERLALDRWCDELCQLVQIQSFEQELRHEKENLADQFVRERNRIEAEQLQFEQNNPLFNVCDTPESCEQYCWANSGVPGCEWAIHIEPDCPGGYFDFGLNQCVFHYPGEGPEFVQCGLGEYFDGFSCQVDPYYQPPTNFQNCPWGMHWNDQFGFCETDFQGPYPTGPDGPGPFPPNGPYPIVDPPETGCPAGEYWDPYYGCTSSQCPPGMFWDGFTNYCVPECGPGEFFDSYFGHCVLEIECPAGFYPDHFSGECFQECGLGEYFDYFDQTCKIDNWQGCGPGLFWNPSTDSCEPEFCPDYFAPVRICAPGEVPIQPEPWDHCGQPSCVSDLSQCPFDISAAMPIPCPAGFYRDIVTDINGCQSFGECLPHDSTPPDACPDIYEPVCGTDNVTYPNDCELNSAGIGFSYYGVCETTPYVDECPQGQYYAYELDRCLNDRDYVPGKLGNCEAGWVWSGDYCAVDDSVTGDCATYCEPSCSANSYCEYNQFGCAVGCVETGEPGAETCGNNFCGAGEDQYICPTDCYEGANGSCNNNGFCDIWETSSNCSSDCSGYPDYPGDENSCPGFAYSRWDAQGVRYCQLNSEQRCDYNYPSYLTEGVNYAEANCPVDDTITTGYCGDGACSGSEDAYSCSADCGAPPVACPASIYNNYGSDSTCNYNFCSDGCYFDNNGCPNDCYDPDYVCPSTEATTPGNRSQCDMAACPLGCEHDYYGCPSACLTDTSVVNCGVGWNWDSQTNSCIKDGVTCNDPTACSACSSANTTGQWCDYNDVGCPLGCQGSTGSCNYNGFCDVGEYASSCSDCSSAGSCPSTAYNDYTTGWNCSYTQCPNGCDWDGQGCAIGCAGTHTACDNDGTCDLDESASSCPADCSGSSGSCNYNGTCDSNEDPASCPGDCVGGTSCPATQYNYYTSGYTCDPAVCSNGCDYDAQGCPVGCDSGSGTSSCNFNGICESSESTHTCSDCAGGSSCGSINSQATCEGTTDCYWYSDSSMSYCYYQSYVCDYDGSCESNEDQTQCGDCSSSGSSCNNNGTCESGESTSSCPSDCNTSGSSGCDAYTDESSCVAANDCHWGYGYCYYQSYVCDWNGTCDSGEDATQCGDCTGSTTSGYCGDNVCDSNETESSCWSDCGTGSSGVTCPSTQYNDYTTTNNCSYSACPNGCMWDSSSCPIGCDTGSSSGGSCASDYNNCYTQSECESNGYGWCNGYCWSSYSSSSCATSSSYCGDGTCGSSEDSSSCPSDCGGSQGFWCGDGNCDPGEDSSWCSEDCGAVQGAATRAHAKVLDAAIGYEPSQTQSINLNPFRAVLDLIF